MSEADILNFQSFKATLVNFNGIYILAYGWLLGMSIWVSFFGGTIAFRSLPRQQFGALQHRVFPAYFLSSISLSSLLLGIWIFNHPDVLPQWFQPRNLDVAQAYALSIVLMMQSSNHFVIGPMTSRTMFQRQKQEKNEGKDHHHPQTSAEMKLLNRKFAALHGLSSLANLFSILALVFHGLWLGKDIKL